MPVMHNYYCPACNEEKRDRWSDDVPTCCDGEPMRISFAHCGKNFEWGSERYIESLDMSFGSRSELNRYLRENNLTQAPSADKHGGARNEELLHLGRKYSYTGAPTS